jgi:outer membrane protein OmpA-like peptidoglycan-associated protein
VRKISVFGLIAVIALPLTSGCAMSSIKREWTMIGAAIGTTFGGGGTRGNLNAYSESVEEPPPVPPPPLMAQQSAAHPLSAREQQFAPLPPNPSLLAPLPTPSATPTATPTPPPSPKPTPPPTATPAPPRPAPAAVPETAAEEVIILRGVFFAKNRSDLGVTDQRILDLAVDTLKRHPDARIFVKGYSDSRGRPEVNQRLSQERAATVAAYLESKGVPLSQLSVLGMGATHPIATNATATGRAKNRRVELEPVIEQP